MRTRGGNEAEVTHLAKARADATSTHPCLDQNLDRAMPTDTCSHLCGCALSGKPRVSIMEITPLSRGHESIVLATMRRIHPPSHLVMAATRGCRVAAAQSTRAHPHLHRSVRMRLTAPAPAVVQDALVSRKRSPALQWESLILILLLQTPALQR